MKHTLSMMDHWFQKGQQGELEITTHSPEQTLEIGSAISSYLKSRQVIALVGDLGAGKTVLIKGIAKGLGLSDMDQVKSPTFVFMHIYDAKIPIYHFDLYRLESTKELESLDFEEYVEDPHAVICVEWAERATGCFPNGTLFAYIELQGPMSRKIKLKKYSISEPANR